MNHLNNPSRRVRRSRRRGIEAIEVLVAFPLVLLVLGAGFEYSWALIKLGQLDHAARAGARAATFPEANNGTVMAQVGDILDSVGLSDASVEISPGDPSSLPAGSVITVTVRVDYEDHELLGLSFLPMPSVLTGEAAMVREP